jgi:hypothetical protein
MKQTLAITVAIIVVLGFFMVTAVLAFAGWLRIK